MVIELFSHQEKMRENIDYNFFYNMTTFYFIFKFIAERVELKWDSLPGGDGKIGVVVAYREKMKEFENFRWKGIDYFA